MKRINIIKEKFKTSTEIVVTAMVCLTVFSSS